MKHTCYHVLTEKHDKFLDSLDDARIIAEKWKSEGDSHFQVYKISTEEVGSDEIILDEVVVPLGEIFKN